MLRSIPRCIMRETAVLKYPNDTDEYGEVSYISQEIKNIHIQPTHSIVRTKDNSEERLSAVLFYDVKISTPFIDFYSLISAVDVKSKLMKVIQNGITYTVVFVDFLKDDESNLHHIELGLV